MLMSADCLNGRRWLARGAMSAAMLSLLACTGTGGNYVATACPTATWWDVRSQAQAGDVPLTTPDGDVVFVAARPSLTLPVAKVRVLPQQGVVRVSFAPTAKALVAEHSAARVGQSLELRLGEQSLGVLHLNSQVSEQVEITQRRLRREEWQALEALSCG